MQKLVLSVLQESVVQGQNHRVLVTLLDNGFLVCCVDTVSSDDALLDIGQSRLSAAHDAAASAGHDLDEMIFLLTALNLFHNLAGICKTRCDTDLDIHAVVRNGELTDEGLFFTVTHAALSDLIHGVLVVARYQTADNRLCNTAGYTEDYTAAGTEAERDVRSFRLNCVKINTGGKDHIDHFLCCQNEICILLTFGQDSVAEAFEAYRYAMSVFGQLVRENMLTTILLVFLFIAAIIGSIMKFYASIAVGHLWGSHPIMGAVIAYIVFGIIESNLFFLCVTVSKRFLDAIDLMIESETLPPVAAGTFLAIAVVYTLIYGFITWFVLDKKLNLE